MNLNGEVNDYVSKWVFHLSSAVIFDRQPKLTLELSFLINLGVLFHRYITAGAGAGPGAEKYHSLENPFKNAKKKLFLTKVILETQ